MVIVSEFEPKKFLIFSKKLLEIENVDPAKAFHRSAISRAYYSAFLFAREKIDSIDDRALDRTRPDIHKQVAVSSCLFDTTLPDDLFELRDYRTDADYRFHNAKNEHEQSIKSNKDPNIRETVENCIEMAEDIIERIELSS